VTTERIPDETAPDPTPPTEPTDDDEEDEEEVSEGGNTP
jgi:hypothetical protein